MLKSAAGSPAVPTAAATFLCRRGPCMAGSLQPPVGGVINAAATALLEARTRARARTDRDFGVAGASGMAAVADAAGAPTSAIGSAGIPLTAGTFLRRRRRCRCIARSLQPPVGSVVSAVAIDRPTLRVYAPPAATRSVVTLTAVVIASKAAVAAAAVAALPSPGPVGLPIAAADAPAATVADVAVAEAFDNLTAALLIVARLDISSFAAPPAPDGVRFGLLIVTSEPLGIGIALGGIAGITSFVAPIGSGSDSSRCG